MATPILGYGFDPKFVPSFDSGIENYAVSSDDAVVFNHYRLAGCDVEVRNARDPLARPYVASFNFNRPTQFRAGISTIGGGFYSVGLSNFREKVEMEVSASTVQVGSAGFNTKFFSKLTYLADGKGGGITLTTDVVLKKNTSLAPRLDEKINFANTNGFVTLSGSGGGADEFLDLQVTGNTIQGSVFDELGNLIYFAKLSNPRYN